VFSSHNVLKLKLDNGLMEIYIYIYIEGSKNAFPLITKYSRQF